MAQDLVYQIITDRIIAQIEQGTAPWQKPWSGGEAFLPQNMVSKKAYRGINTFILGFQGYASPYWLSFPKQVNDAGGRLRAGEKCTYIVFWTWAETRNKVDGSQTTIPILRYYKVVNTEQCDGLKRVPAMPAVPDTTIEKRIDVCDLIIDAMPHAPAIVHSGAQAYYQPTLDKVTMPPTWQFHSMEEYYSTLFHELGHSTGHKDRLNRSTLNDLCRFGDTNYSKEELVAEMTAAYLCGIAGIENRTVDNSEAYLAGWLKKLKSDVRLLVQAAAQAQKAADYIRGLYKESNPE